METELIRTFTAHTIEEIVEIEHQCFPASDLEEFEEYYREMIPNKKCINVVLKEKNKIIGYALARPYRMAYREIVEEDPRMKNIKNPTFYLDTIGILPKYRGKGGVGFIMDALVGAMHIRGCHLLAGHMRISNGLDAFMRKHYTCKRERIVYDWAPYGGQEPTCFQILSV